LIFLLSEQFKGRMTIFQPYFCRMKDFNTGKIRIIGFDADDTLWVNEPFYRETERKFCELLSKFTSPDEINKQLFSIEVKNLDLYGYGSKAFILSLIETGIVVSEGKITADIIESILAMGKAQISEKNPLLPGVPDVLRILSEHYRLIVVTKGDLLDQERKLRNSGIGRYFHHIEIMSDKTSENYRKLLTHLDVQPPEFLMVGNSLKSDVLPVVNLGAYAIHVPFHITWQHEELEPHEMPDSHFITVDELSEVLPVLGINMNP
jgi:putative hydrolase of the HAD superfamily